MNSPVVTRALGRGGEEHAGDHKLVSRSGPQQVPAGPGRYLDDVVPVDELAHAGSPVDQLKHGRLSTYQWYGCHCRKCREANAARVRKIRAAHREERLLAEQEIQGSPEGDQS